VRIPTDASAENYRKRACQVRELAATIANPEERDLLIDIAERYARLAEATGTSAPKASAPLRCLPFQRHEQ